MEVTNQRLRLLTAALSSGSVWCFENLWLKTCTRRLLNVATQLDKLLLHQKHLLCTCVLVAILSTPTYGECSLVQTVDVYL